jgi:hypothetical protein
MEDDFRWGYWSGGSVFWQVALDIHCVSYTVQRLESQKITVQ